MAGPTLDVPAPKRAPREGGILTVAELRPNDRLAHVEAIVFQGDGNDFAHTEESRCYAPQPVADKTFDGIEITEGLGTPFTIYAGVRCFEAPDPDEVERARRALETGRERVIEGRLAAWAAGGTALAPGATARAAVGRVDQALDDGYVARGVILISRFDAADAGLEYTEGEPLRTKTGTPVIASGRVAPGMVYGLGAVTVEHGEIVERDVHQVRFNRHWALAEQPHALIVDAEFRVSAAITNA
ncbi:hypothetical protein DBR36_06545 [Microbacterium sp. HMWF026]|uniref:hypothetical protein n=1 Tax=Microbacterium sp. HMWF026 TaxID=2056861 RepID=UPI000D334F9F|nr:hypothetical protein [Microbacterium sp. HMWF026]PTT20059.1 hypothetical protein DBR36_06545 [Microbacterium sp. HMWF026]